MSEEDKKTEVLRELEAMMSGMDSAELGQLASGMLGMLSDRMPIRPERPDLRQPPRDEVCIYRLRVDLDHARPPIWRRLDVRSDLTLDVVHEVLQTAFGWTDTHLHRFALGGSPFDVRSQVFLCPYDVEEEDEDEDGEAASDVRLDETLQGPGDRLRYVYDYGDAWELTLRLEEVRPSSDDSAIAVCVGGRRQAPPEDCGGLTDADQLAEVLDDPSDFAIEEINAALI